MYFTPSAQTQIAEFKNQLFDSKVYFQRPKIDSQEPNNDSQGFQLDSYPSKIDYQRSEIKKIMPKFDVHRPKTKSNA